MFPVIKHIDDVLPHIANKPEIVRIEKDGYTILDYIYAGVSTFDNNYARECRGIKFDSQGNLIGRPFHKFFNLNETEETKFENQDWSQQLFIHNKWDGSMIHPALVNGELVFMTRKGVTDVALQAMSECEYDADEMIRHIRDGFTPIYEFISPNNKIVLHYDEARLVPLNMRHRETGAYNRDRFQNNAVHLVQNVSYFETLLHQVKNNTGLEGIVIQFDKPSRFIKFKADDYVALHRVLDETAHEKRVLALIMDDKLDDVAPLIAPARAEHLKAYASDVNEALFLEASRIVTYVRSTKYMSQKDFAEVVQRDFLKQEQSFYFKARTHDSLEVQSILVMLKKFFKKTLTTQVKVDSWRVFLGNPKFEMQVD